MIIVLVGASGSGKSALEKEISSHYGYNKVISYTTRPKRENEVNGRDYRFISEESFQAILEQGLFAEYDEYSQNRKYGSLISDYKNGDGVVVLTPNGLRQVKEMCKDSVFSVYVDSNLGTRVKRYIDRCGVEKFNFDDKNEIAARVERDYVMFLGIEREVDMVIENNEGSNLRELAWEIVNAAKEADK